MHMSRSNTLIFFSILIILIPFSGLPLYFRTLFTIIFALCVFCVGISLRKGRMHTSIDEQKPDQKSDTVSV